MVTSAKLPKREHLILQMMFWISMNLQLVLQLLKLGSFQPKKTVFFKRFFRRGRNKKSNVYCRSQSYFQSSKRTVRATGGISDFLKLKDMIAIVEFLLDLKRVRKFLKIFVEKHGKIKITIKFLVIEQKGNAKTNFMFVRKAKKIYLLTVWQKEELCILYLFWWNVLSKTKEGLEALEQKANL